MCGRSTQKFEFWWHGLVRQIGPGFIEITHMCSHIPYCRHPIVVMVDSEFHGLILISVQLLLSFIHDIYTSSCVCVLSPLACNKYSFSAKSVPSKATCWKPLNWMGCQKQKFATWTTNLWEHYVPKKKKAKHSGPEGSENKENIPKYAEHLYMKSMHQTCQMHRVRMLFCALF